MDTHACARADNATEMGPMSHKPDPHPTKGCRQPGPKKVKNSVNFFSHSKVVLPAVPAMSFSQKFFAHFFTVLPEGFFDGFSRFFHTLFRTIFRTVSLAEFFARPFYVFF